MPSWTDKGPDGRYLDDEPAEDTIVEVARKITEGQAFTDADAIAVAEAFLQEHA